MIISKIITLHNKSKFMLTLECYLNKIIIISTSKTAIKNIC